MIELVDVTLMAGNFSIANVCMKVARGEYAVLMGQTGSGKTSILESICGLRRPQSGKVLIADVDVTAWPPGDREIGYVPQDLALFPTHTVREHLEFAMRLKKVPRNTIDSRTSEMAEVLGIDDLIDRSIEGLSGGEKQRVALGRALAFRPNVLLLDEPLSALDQQTREEMQALLTEIKQSTGVTTLHITHNQCEAEALADRRFQIKDGKVLEL